MLPEIPRDVALHPGPVASIYLEVGRTAATITGFDRTGREVLGASAEGQSHPAHKAGGGGTAHYSLEHRTEEVWARNARAFAADIDRAVSQLHAELESVMRFAGWSRSAPPGGPVMSWSSSSKSADAPRAWP